jgi:hypothetical protein
MSASLRQSSVRSRFDRVGGYGLGGFRKRQTSNSDKSLAGRETLNPESEGTDISFFAQAGDPAFLKLLCFVLDQFFLDIGARFGE